VVPYHETVDSRIWYIAYGSNLLSSRLQRYFDLQETDEKLEFSRTLSSRRPVMVDHTLYFAGDSKTWGGPVAFLSLTSQGQTQAAAYLMQRSNFVKLAIAENGSPLNEVELGLDDVPVGGWRPLPVYPGGDARRGKYNALLRLDDIDGLPAITLTTHRDLSLGIPSDEYLDAIRTGTSEVIGLTDEGAAHLLDGAVERSKEGRNTSFVNANAGAQLIISETARRDMTLPLESVWLPADRREMVDGMEAVTATASGSGKSMQVWVFFSEKMDSGCRASAGVYDALGLESGPIRLSVPTIERAERHPGLLGDLPDADVVQVHANLAERLGPWALAVSPVLTGPVRVQARSHVEDGSIRLPYAARTLLGLKKQDRLVLQSLDADAPGRKSLVGRSIRAVGEWLLGAPVTPLRSTEGLVGDDGRHVVRVDSTALDFLGIDPGGRAVLSWGHRSMHVRVLLQTEGTREQMRKQLEESTGLQERLSTGDAENRKFVPEHMRVWVAASVRSRLNIPPDSTVRLRRSISHLAMGNLSVLSLPLAALVVAAAAAPSVDWSVWAGLVVLVIILSGLPLRLR
jgi:hypothetical protein